VLGVISSSQGELQPVFKAILANAKRLCEAQFGILYLSDGDMLRFGADIGTSPKFAEFQRQRGVFRPRPGTRLEHVMLTKEVSHTADLAATTVPDMSDVLAVRDPLFTCRCLRTSKSSASSASSARKSARSPTSRSRSYRILPPTLHHLIVTFKTL